MSQAGKERFTAWLSVAERNELRREAAEFDTSENYVLRMIIRKHYNMGAPRTAAIRTIEKDNNE